MTSHEIRSLFLNYFKKQGHTIVDSSRLIPDGDPTILFTNAGMNQFKNAFLGLEKRDYVRAATSQKCVRAGGKHNDLENVGFTARHHTFFEMLGNFSFGDYFKKEAIHFAWELITKDLGLPKDRIYVTAFEKDDEAADIWHKQEGVPKDRIFRFGEKDNFWRMGNVGPCGPCSEIFFDLDPSQKGDPFQSIAAGEDRIIEFWNLVFMQFNEKEDGTQSPLPKPSVDTGMGLERLATILQGKKSNYENDGFRSLIQEIQNAVGMDYVTDLQSIANEKARNEQDNRNVSMRVLADHGRASSFLIADGVLPSNDGRGYVLRRILRRAIRYGRNLSKDKSLLSLVVEKVVQNMGSVYPELVARQKHILSTILDEERRFLSTLDQGTHILNDELMDVEKSGSKILSGKFTFKLYDTFGFPMDLTRLMAKEKGVEIDESGFEKEFANAKEIARASWRGQSMSGTEASLISFAQKVSAATGHTEFLGYNGVLKSSQKLLAICDGNNSVQKLAAGMDGYLVFSKTPFYAESGGQVGDVGTIVTSSGAAEVIDCRKANGLHVHVVKVTDGTLSVDELCQLTVDEIARRNTAAHHSATHLLHSALRKHLGTHVTQAGSQVGPDKLRFDFTHNKTLSQQDIDAIHKLVRNEIAQNTSVETALMKPKDAMAAGAIAMFGEKYGDEVRVLTMGDFSKELCGGTHVKSTAQVRLFQIVSETGVSAGVRRIEALCADAAENYVSKHMEQNMEARHKIGLQEGWSQFLESSSNVGQWIEKTKKDIKNLEKKLQDVQASQIDPDVLLKEASTVSGFESGTKFLFCHLEIDNREVLAQITDRITAKIGSGAVVMIGKGTDTHPIVVQVTKTLAGKIHAGKLLTEVATALGGKGGGRPDLAQGGGRDLSKLDVARAAALKFLGN
jgi:alanyl-tRNA synthetase